MINILDILQFMGSISQVIAIGSCLYFLKIMWRTHIDNLHLRNELLVLKSKLGSLAVRHANYLDKVEELKNK